MSASSVLRACARTPAMATVLGTRMHLRALAAASMSSSDLKTDMLRSTWWKAGGDARGERKRARLGESVHLVEFALREELVRHHARLVHGQAPARDGQALQQHVQATT